MECPRCKRDVDTLWGHVGGVHQCTYCFDEDTGIAVVGFFKAVLIVVGLMGWGRVIEILWRA